MSYLGNAVKTLEEAGFMVTEAKYEKACDIGEKHEGNIIADREPTGYILLRVIHRDAPLVVG
jgi:hypothetical protein